MLQFGTVAGVPVLGVCPTDWWSFLTELSTLSFQGGYVGGAALSLFSDGEPALHTEAAAAHLPSVKER